MWIRCTLAALVLLSSSAASFAAGRVSFQTGAHHLSLDGWDLRRCAHTPRCREALSATRAAIRRREQARCRNDNGNQDGCQCKARWVRLAGDLYSGLSSRTAPLPGGRIRPGHFIHSDRDVRPRLPILGRASVGPGQDGQGTRRPRQGQARNHHLRPRRTWAMPHTFPAELFRRTPASICCTSRTRAKLTPWWTC